LIFQKKMNIFETAQAMVAPGKGVLAIDESHSTCKKRFDALNIPCDEAHRRNYRDLLISAPGIEESVSGMILFDETLHQSTLGGTPFPEVLKAKGMIPGIKVDAGAKDLALCPGEKVTEGLDGLRERLTAYKALGVGFAKWRAVITIGEGIPSEACLLTNAHALARYAALCQEVGIVPMVEPEVIMDGDHSLEQCAEVTAKILRVLFEQLALQKVDLRATILKTSMVISGTSAQNRASVAEVAEATVRVLKENVPAEIAGVVFLSGGQDSETATAHLNEMNKKYDLPWSLSFSYGRAIQQPALEKWAGDEANREEAQGLLVFHAEQNGKAATGSL